MVRTPQIAARLSCFAIISAIEDDLRERVSTLAELNPSIELLPADVKDKALKRARENAKDMSETALLAQDDVALFSYTDFGDLAKILRMGQKQSGVEKDASVMSLALQLEKLVPSRNRVCHSRPLEADDFQLLFDFAQSISDIIPGMIRCRATVAKLLEDSTFVLDLTIPTFWSVDVSQIQHNLPLPEFDETGFLGRAKDRREVTKLLSSPHPVVTIVGEGGVGKTALAIRCLYDIIEKSESTEFDALIWISLKSQTLTANGVKEIRGVINDVIGVVRDIADELGVPGVSEISDIDLLIREIEGYLREFRILLAIDNIETLAKETLRPLLSAIPKGSKVLLTSRIGLGEIELRYPLDPLDKITAVALMRRLANHLNVSVLTRLSDEQATQLCNAVFYNPLLIKWFVSAVAGGWDPAAILSRTAPSFNAALSFCFENLFNKLSNDEKYLIYILASARKPLSQAELHYLAKEIRGDQLEWAISTLLYSSVLRRSIATEQSQSPTTYYALTEIASEYVSKIAPPPPDIFKMVQSSLKELHMMVEGDRVAKATYAFNIFAIHAKSRDEVICSAYLKKALKALRETDPEAALSYVKEAKSILPSYAENYRIAAIVQASQNQIYRASEEYKIALELAPDSPIVHYSYGNFLLHIDDSSQALEHSREAVRLVPNDFTPLTLMALCLTRLGEYKEASEIYERVLRACINHPRKWRLSTRDQAAECYRRWMEQDYAMRDYLAHVQHLASSLGILKEAFITGDYDEKTAERFERVLDQGIRHIIDFNDEEGARIIAHVLRQIWSIIEKSSEARRLVERLKHYYPQIGIEDFESLSKMSKQFLKENISTVTKAVALTRRTQEWKHGEEVLGKIKSIVSDKGFGFITSQDGSEWFFHWSAVRPPARWNSLQVGEQVKFHVGSNSNGRCAVDIGLA
jgi:LuxR family glucitol operon transcriptional activator